MAITFEVPKAFDEIKPPPKIDPGVYKFALKSVTRSPNKAGDGENIELELTMIGEREELNGVSFTQYLSMPNQGDVDRTTRSGQSMVDWKMDKIQKNVLALGGQIKGNSFSFPDHAVCKAKVVLRKREEGDDMFPWLDGDLMATDEPLRAAKKKS